MKKSARDSTTAKNSSEANLKKATGVKKAPLPDNKKKDDRIEKVAGDKKELAESGKVPPQPAEAGKGNKKNSCRDEILAMRLFEADSTASYRLTKIAYLKLYNRLTIRKAVDILFQAYAERGLLSRRPVPTPPQQQNTNNASLQLQILEL